MLPIIQTKRLILRTIQLSDAADMYEYAKTPDVGPVAGWEPHPDLNHTLMIINMFKMSAAKTGLGVFAIVLKENKKMIGTIELFNHYQHFKAELGYALNKDYWGNGYVAEAAKGVLKWAFEDLALKRVEVNLFVDNYRSERVCQKLGMHYEGIKKKGYMRYDGKIFDEKVYHLTDDEYFKKGGEDL